MTILYFLICAIGLMAILYPWRNKALKEFRKKLKPGDMANYKLKKHYKPLMIRIAIISGEDVFCYSVPNPDQRFKANIQNVYPV